jgi:ketosteroid isomerase-like protein
VTASSNLDLVRSLYAAWARGDFSRQSWMHPDIEWTIADGPSAGHWRGVEGSEESFRGMLSAWEGLRLEPEDYHELDGGRILVLVRVSGRGKTSGLDLSQTPARAAHLLTIDGGKVMRTDFYWDRDRALADLGLVPE